MSMIERAIFKQDYGEVPADEPPASAESVPRDADTPPSASSAPPDSAQSLDIEGMRRAGLLTPDQLRSRLAEEFRLIKRPLLNNAFGSGAARIRNGNLIMVTSAMPREGKSYCTINLAMSMVRELARTVLLVEADVARPSVLRSLGLSAERGLLDVLVDPALSVGEVILRTDIPNLSVLAAGNDYGHSTELLASEAMARLCAELASRYADRVVIFDSPPLLMTTEAAVLARHIGQVIFLVEAQRTPEQAVVAGLEHLRDCEVVMTMLNKARYAPGTDYGYGHGYLGGY
ncbi:XrtA-associated tyrosine autokinase [Arhodomonas sp. SL1]|uniref:XrtA-associated tyrosine autokinase n=1 Tax=Arhodomonas sp. SL1 TaxID=3425691 RepID=UPI003F8835FB